MTPMQRMGKRIGRYREMHEWSQETLAAKAGISRPYLARLETGRQDPRVSVVLRIARALGVTVNDLLR